VITVTCVPTLAPDGIVAAADACLYEAKAAGRNQLKALNRT
jgi:PleD family two-component response regulator